MKLRGYIWIAAPVSLYLCVMMLQLWRRGSCLLLLGASTPKPRNVFWNLFFKHIYVCVCVWGGCIYAYPIFCQFSDPLSELQVVLLPSTKLPQNSVDAFPNIIFWESKLMSVSKANNHLPKYITNFFWVRFRQIFPNGNTLVYQLPSEAWPFLVLPAREGVLCWIFAGTGHKWILFVLLNVCRWGQPLNWD